MEPLDLAREYLLSTRLGQPEALEHEARLSALDPASLVVALADDAARNAFWIDVYNGAVLRHAMPAEASMFTRLRHFRDRFVEVGGQRLSLDAIEHGILRRSRWRFGLGYLGNPLPSRYERTHRVEQVDPRIHFALNCGVASCPPIAAYDAAHIDEQLERATLSYLQAESNVSPAGIALPAILLWYIGDFGGRRGIRRMLQRYGIEGADRRLRFKRYDWTPDPARWRPDER